MNNPAKSPALCLQREQMLKIRLIIKAFVGFILLAFAASVVVTLVFRSGDTFEPWGWQRRAVWMSKRLVAETAALALKVHDPYKGRRIPAVKGPVLCDSELPESAPVETAAELRACLDQIPGIGTVGVAAFRNGTLPDSRFAFHYQTSQEPKLDSLRVLYSLDTLVAGSESDYRTLCRLSDWLTAFFEADRSVRNTIPETDFNFNALDILHRAGRGERFWCSEYSTSLVQCMAALGFTGRYVMINSETGGHVTVEVWCETFDKWIMLDPFFGLRVVLDGVPLNVLEVHSLALDPDDRDRVRIEQVLDVPFRGGTRDFYLSLFRTFAVRMRNDWFTNKFPHWYPLSNSVMNAVEWQDSLTFKNVFHKYETSRKEDLYWPLNEVRLRLHPLEGGRFRVKLDTFTPNFSHYQIWRDSQPEVHLDGPAFDWRPHPGRNYLAVRAVNDMGRAGKISFIDLTLEQGGETR